MPSINFVIECDGDFWHANPEKLFQAQKEKIKSDKLKDEYLKANGWKVIRFFETDIKKDIINCTDMIEKAIITDAFEKAGYIWEEKID